MRRIALHLVVCMAGAWLAAACGERVELGPVELATKVPGASDRGPLPGTWREGERTEPVTFTWDRPTGPRWRTGSVLDTDGDLRARILLGPTPSLLLYHAAFRDPAWKERLQVHRLASIAGAGVALLFGPDAGDPTRGETSLTDLSASDAAKALAAAAALGAWLPLRNGQLARDGLLPVFQPEAPGPWENLRGSTLEGFLPPELAERVVSTRGLRAAAYAQLAEDAKALPRLADAVEALSPTPSEELRELLENAAHHYTTYLDSAWAELLVAQVSPDAARLALHVQTVIPLELLTFELPLPRSEALARSDAIGRLRLRDRDSGDVAAAQLGKKGIVFTLSRSIEPVARGPYQFGSTRLHFRLDGLDASPELREALLEQLQARLVKASSGAPLPQDHWRRVLSIADRRFGAARDETLDEFLEALPSRLRRDDGEGGDGELVKVDAARQIFTLPPGRYRATGDFIPPPGWGLLMSAGVELAVAPGRSLLLRGPLFVNGSAGRPVRITALGEDAPWGVLALQGRGLALAGSTGLRPRSTIRHLEMSGGSQDDLRGVHYGGQLSVFHQELVMSDTTLRDARGEAALAATRSRVDVRRLAVLDSAADGIQLEDSTGEVRESRVERSRDGVDVSKASDVALVDSVIGDAGDECVEAGERSRLRVSGVLLRRCQVGLVSKDLARVAVRQSAFVANGTHMSAYQNLRVFGPGVIETNDVQLLDADAELSAAESFSADALRR